MFWDDLTSNVDFVVTWNLLLGGGSGGYLKEK